jgi:hypothetical protein
VRLKKDKNKTLSNIDLENFAVIIVFLNLAFGNKIKRLDKKPGSAGNSIKPVKNPLIILPVFGRTKNSNNHL